MIDSIRKNGVILAIFAAVTTGVTALVNEVTKPTVAEQMAIQEKTLLDQVVPPHLYNNDLQKECYWVTNPVLGDNQQHPFYIARKDGKPVAAAIETVAPDGYSGAIRMLVGANFSGTVLGVRVTEHHETPGLGDKIELRISDWITHFAGVSIHGPEDSHFAVKKDGGDFDQFTGATITPRAVVNETKRTTLLIAQLGEKINTLPKCGDKTP
ncbi:electron transport complex subunit RsxG [Rosenbergiella epipactidis]|uniref:electron transport complex subunit RsxG n=1 Tax=Rosenbergiella epipactidis TaxID=1544694 RepID=UPI0006646229|nr:electron transport complex subunit RsxG [Rosenbergiella epipactidis]KMV73409.1 electron transporter RnfG [bacteria symbiont BFo2 of Frankliniella occidentalis]KYP93902.1 electron transporter RnfG [bacteria symbiont BFo2 of Frankliniella occidentalis]